MKTVSDVRSVFLEFFRRNGHEVRPSASLIPHNDPTLMFTAAGMVPFKNVFTGQEKVPYSRAASSQKCVRAGGKHNDLDNVGYTARHHTFFEMLGNFSFGDYFKEQAIHYAWELLTKDFALPPEKLWVTVYHTDDEAFNVWKKLTGFADEKIIRIASSDNFWSAGDTGPCGPCSEIFYDHGAHIEGGPPGSPGEDGDRFVEIWNLVFMQYEQLADINGNGGERINLPKPSIDTGMGLERISAVIQGVHDNYDIDLFRALIAASKQASGNSDPAHAVSHRVIADHLRSTCFLMADGVLPSNEGRGYVLRRIMRRGMRHAHLLGAKEPLMHRLVPALVAEMGEAYPELKRAEAMMADNLRQEEERFRQTLERGLKLLEEEVSSLAKGAALSGEAAFKLYDTYGFPLDLTQDILRGRGLTVDSEGFEKSMDAQRERARGAWSGSGEQAVGKLWFGLREQTGATHFSGYDKDEDEVSVRAIVKGGEAVQQADAGDEVFLVLDVTPFYGESGGQVGDSGWLRVGGKTVAEVGNTQKPLEDFLVHQAKLSAPLKVGDKVTAAVDAHRRDRTRANHSATHLLHKALREVLGDHVTQKGSLVAPDRLRFDISHPKPLSREEITEVEKRVNAKIWRNTPVSCVESTPDEAIAAGAMALFGEKYGNKVRVLSMGAADAGHYSVELCGGTHVRATGDIGLFKIVSEGAVAAGVRRIEALTAEGAFEYLNGEDALLREIAGGLKVSVADLPARIEQLAANARKLEKELAEAKKQLALGGGGGDAPAMEKETIGGVEFIGKIYGELPPKELRPVAESMLKQLENGVAFVASGFEGKASVVVAVSKPLNEQISAVALVQAAVEALGGKGGGGRPDMAQGGGPDAAQLTLALVAVKAKLGK